MHEREQSPLDVIEAKTVGETDFGVFIQLLVRDVIPVFLSREDLSALNITQRDRVLEDAIGFLTERVLSNRKKDGLQCSPDALLVNSPVWRLFEEFIIDKDLENVIVHGIFLGFERAGYLEG